LLYQELVGFKLDFEIYFLTAFFSFTGKHHDSIVNPYTKNGRKDYLKLEEKLKVGS
jgi:hypothetical protein